MHLLLIRHGKQIHSLIIKMKGTVIVHYLNSEHWLSYYIVHACLKHSTWYFYSFPVLVTSCVYIICIAASFFYWTLWLCYHRDHPWLNASSHLPCTTTDLFPLLLCTANNRSATSTMVSGLVQRPSGVQLPSCNCVTLCVWPDWRQKEEQRLRISIQTITVKSCKMHLGLLNFYQAIFNAWHWSSFTNTIPAKWLTEYMSD